MHLDTAIHLISSGIEKSSSPQVWVDLGAGRGLFTKALAFQLPAESIIHAVDTDAAALRTIELPDGITLRTQQHDFVHDELHLPLLDGVLMANSLHYVKDKYTFMKAIRSTLKPAGRIILVEYDTSRSNTWVPYPIAYTALEKFAHEFGFSSVQKLAEAPSVYQGSMYAALLL
ncbi:class I SAM-dependent methyltransferase [Ohtaekwangia sp.]|uniref:class I SAM-dependent methyltransferase n=1 Tax=Ohtaekwangia sp. TaxID=2066019 RepID=UPI002FDCEFE4